MFSPVTKQELLDRIARLHAAADKSCPNAWDAVMVVDKINQYYLTATMQDGLFVLLKDGSYAYFVRTSPDRAKIESPLDTIYPMSSYKDAAGILNRSLETVFIEMEVMPLGTLERLRKYFALRNIMPLGKIIGPLKAVKSPYEMSLMEEAGRGQSILQEKVIPSLLHEGISETELNIRIYEHMIRLGHQGVTRFAMFQTDMLIGQLGFGDSSLYPTSFDGPGGMRGLSPYAPFVGNKDKCLKKGDYVYIDIGFGVGGYHTDRTQVYRFGVQPDEESVKLHMKCLEIQKQVAAMLVPGQTPSGIYNTVMAQLDSEFINGFMGYGGKTVKFLGHGVGLQIDEYPAIAKGFDEPLVENMMLAVEPKKGLIGIGMFGVEDTYAVAQNGGRCLTGGEKEIMVV